MIASYLITLLAFLFVYTFYSVESLGLVKNAKTDHSYAAFKMNSYRYLNVTRKMKMEQTLATDEYDCAAFCLDTSGCFSCNFDTRLVDHDQHECELLTTDMFNSSTKLTESQNFTHLSIETPCFSGPCANGGSCVAKYEQDDYVCVCTSGYIGRNCEHDICQTSLHKCSPNATCNNSIGWYTCHCKVGFTGDGVNCTDPNLQIPLTWPVGTYGLPKTIYGCPHATRFQWHAGWRLHDTEDSNAENHWSNPYHLAGYKSKNDMSQEFCLKTAYRWTAYDVEWPKGEYCLFKKGTCPSGFQTGSIGWDDEDTNNHNNIGGSLPDGEYGHGNTRIYYCCRADGFATNSISLPTDKPFVLFKKANTCQKVHGMRSISEYFYWDTEDEHPNNSDDGEIPRSEVGDNINIEYCYYYL